MLVTERCGRAKHIADLFCGVGPFALRLATRARIAAFDSDAGAVSALQKAATATSGLKPVKAEARDLFRRPLMPQELRDFDAVVFDPPRQGAQAQAQQLAASKVGTVIAVSCNAATFARDARILVDGGYKLEAVTPVDQFRHTPHVELVARFRSLNRARALSHSTSRRREPLDRLPAWLDLATAFDRGIATIIYTRFHICERSG